MTDLNQSAAHIIKSRVVSWDNKGDCSHIKRNIIGAFNFLQPKLYVLLRYEAFAALDYIALCYFSDKYTFNVPSHRHWVVHHSWLLVIGFILYMWPPRGQRALGGVRLCSNIDQVPMYAHGDSHITACCVIVLTSVFPTHVGIKVNMCIAPPVNICRGSALDH